MEVSTTASNAAKRPARAAAPPKTKPIKRDWMTVNMVANEVQVHHKTVRSWIRKGHLPAYRVLGQVRVDRADLDLLVARLIPPAQGGVL